MLGWNEMMPMSANVQYAGMTPSWLTSIRGKTKDGKMGKKKNI